MHSAGQLDQILDAFPSLRAIVAGDIILDRYWWGEAHRLSPEAPVPVLLKRGVSALPGGAANAAANLAALGARVDLVGVVGEDREADELRAVLAARSIGAAGVLAAPGRPTTIKTRLIAGHQQLLRVDEEETGPIDPALAGRVLAAFRERIDSADLVILSDYAKGLLTPQLLEAAIAEARRAAKPVFVDPKGHDASRFRGATLLKPNRLELGLLVGCGVRTHAETLAAGRQLRDALEGAAVLATEAADGMSYFGPGGEEIHVASESRQVFDITGAGDTVIASFALAVAAGAPAAQAMSIASVAAGISISKLGAATVSVDEIRRALR